MRVTIWLLSDEEFCRRALAFLKENDYYGQNEELVNKALVELEKNASIQMMESLDAYLSQSNL